jgi:hypothetical protein
MEQFKVGAAVGVNGLMAMVQSVAASDASGYVLILAQIGVAVVTIIYIATKVWKLWRNKKDE